MDRTFKLIKEQVLGENWELNWTVLEGKKSTPEELEEALATVPFASSKRVVVLREVLDFWKSWGKSQGERIIQAFIHPPPHTLLILHQTGKLKEKGENRKRKGKDPGQWLMENLKDTQAVVVDFTGTRQELERWVKRQLKKEGLPVDQEAVEWLLDVSQEKMALLETELEKFILWGKKGEDIDRPPSLWDVPTMIYKGDPRLITHLEVLMGERGPSYFYRIVSSSISRMVAARQALEEGATLQEAVAKASPFYKERKALAEALKDLTLQEGMELLELAMETEIALKSGARSPQRDLERIMIRVVGRKTQEKRKGKREAS